MQQQIQVKPDAIVKPTLNGAQAVMALQIMQEANIKGASAAAFCGLQAAIEAAIIEAASQPSPEAAPEEKQ